MKKRVFVFGVAVLALALAFVLTDAIVSALAAGVTEGNIRRIRVGMLKHQVERLLGKPGQYLPFFNAPYSGGLGVWEAPGLRVDVSFDRLWRVEWASFTDQRSGLVLFLDQKWEPMKGEGILGFPH